MSSTQAPSVQTLTDTILAIITDAGDRWMPLTDLRARLTAPRDDVDTVLADLMVNRQIRIIPESNQKMLTEADRKAALVLAGKPRHLVTLNR